MMGPRDERQSAVYRWVGETFGVANLETQERCKRFVEEAVELAQAEGLTAEEVSAIVAYVYSKSPGEVFQEAGGVGTTLLAYCEARGISADDAEDTEFRRVVELNPEHFRRRHNIKAAAGIANTAPSTQSTNGVVVELRDEARVLDLTKQLLPDDAEELYPRLALVVHDGELGTELARLLVNAYEIGRRSMKARRKR
jgi:hypothetical protein